jgi:hypothetical protein
MSTRVGKAYSPKMRLTRLRKSYLLAIFVAAVVTAAALRHFVHVNGGFSREEIRMDALIAAALIVLAIIFFRRKHRP